VNINPNSEVNLPDPLGIIQNMDTSQFSTTVFHFTDCGEEDKGLSKEVLMGLCFVRKCEQRRSTFLVSKLLERLVEIADVLVDTHGDS